VFTQDDQLAKNNDWIGHGRAREPPGQTPPGVVQQRLHVRVLQRRGGNKRGKLSGGSASSGT
jgi:hypothetical protein